MICNDSITIYHKGFDNTTKLEIWTRYNYNNVWFFGEKSAVANKGYDDNNRFNCRIWYEKNKDLTVSNFTIGDIVVQGNLETDITTQQDLNCMFYNITSINDNNFGNNRHIHLGGK